MLKEVKMFTIICDSCGKDVNSDSEFSCWNDESYLEDIRTDSDWEKVDENIIVQIVMNMTKTII